MDTPEYIKMCAALPEDFKKSHEYDEGDYVYCDFTPDGQVYSKIVCIIGTKWWEGACDPLVWLPRLDQLLEMLGGNPISRVSNLYHFKEYSMHRFYGDWKVPDISLEILTLWCIMWTLHGMKWTGESWQPERTDKEKELQ